MKILNLGIEGFRSLKKVSWSPGSLNVIIGPNGSGKSNLLRFLELISVSARGGLGKYIQSLGGMDPIVWDGIAETISFSMISDGQGNETDPNYYGLELSRLGKGSSYRITRESLAWVPNPEKSKANEGVWFPLERQGYAANKRRRLGLETRFFLKRTERSAQIFPTSENSVTGLVESLIEEETVLCASASPLSARQALSDFRERLASVSIYQDLRVDQESDVRRAAVARTEQRVDPDGQNLVPVLHTLYTGDRDFKRNIDEAMKAAFGNDFEELVFPPAADQRIQLRVRWRTLRREQSAADLSDGTLRFLILLTVLSSPSTGSMIAIDEPETGLHPSMLPIIAEYAAEAATRSQVLLTTHSPQMLDAFGDTRPTATVATWCEGETTLHVVSDEELSYWLKDYSLGSLFKSGELESMK